MFLKILLLNLIGFLFSCGSNSNSRNEDRSNREELVDKARNIKQGNERKLDDDIKSAKNDRENIPNENSSEHHEEKILVSKEDFINFSIYQINLDLEEGNNDYNHFKEYLNNNKNNLKSDDLNDGIIELVVKKALQIKEKAIQESKIIDLINVIFENLNKLDLNKMINGKTLFEFFIANDFWKVVKYFDDLGIKLNRNNKEDLMQYFLNKNNGKGDSKGIDYLVRKLRFNFSEGILHQLLKYYVSNNDLEKVTSILIQGLDKEDIRVISIVSAQKEDIIMDPLIFFILNLSLKEENDKRENTIKLIKYFFDNEEVNDKFKKRFELSLNGLLTNKNLETDEFSSIISLIQIYNDFKLLEKFNTIFEILIERGAEINKELNKSTPLYEAINLEFLEIVEKFVKKGIDINRTVNGDTALHLAVRKNLVDIIEILVKNGARFNIKGKGPTALSLVVQQRIQNPKMINKVKELYKEIEFEIHPDDEIFKNLLKN